MINRSSRTSAAAGCIIAAVTFALAPTAPGLADEGTVIHLAQGVLFGQPPNPQGQPQGGQQPMGQAPQTLPTQQGQQPPAQATLQPPPQATPPMQPPAGMQQPGLPGGQGMPAAQGQMAAPAQQELQDFGVPATNQLHSGPMHGPTPTSIPGGRVITTPELVQMLQQGQPIMLIDVLGGPQLLPNSVSMPMLAQPGQPNDQITQQFQYSVAQATGGRNDVPMVFYCQGIQCWMSYNAALRAIAAGQRNVLWYRGGLEAWQAAGLPLQQAGGVMQQGGYGMQGGGYGQQGGMLPPGGYGQHGGYGQQGGTVPPGGYGQQGSYGQDGGFGMQ